MRYIIHPGRVRSQHDGDTHTISAYALIKLYKVNPSLCVPRRLEDVRLKGYRGPIKRLFPRYSGDYNIDNVKVETYI